MHREEIETVLVEEKERCGKRTAFLYLQTRWRCGLQPASMARCGGGAEGLERGVACLQRRAGVSRAGGALQEVIIREPVVWMDEQESRLSPC